MIRTLSVCGVVWLAVVCLFRNPNLAEVNRRATALQALLEQQPRLAGWNVTVTSFTNGRIGILAPEELPEATKADLERFVAHHAPAGVKVSYLRAVDPITPAPKEK